MLLLQCDNLPVLGLVPVLLSRFFSFLSFSLALPPPSFLLEIFQFSADQLPGCLVEEGGGQTYSKREKFDAMLAALQSVRESKCRSIAHTSHTYSTMSIAMALFLLHSHSHSLPTTSLTNSTTQTLHRHYTLFYLLWVGNVYESTHRYSSITTKHSQFIFLGNACLKFYSILFLDSVIAMLLENRLVRHLLVSNEAHRAIPSSFPSLQRASHFSLAHATFT